jgi:hypothetical protein
MVFAPVTSTAPRGHRPDTQRHGTDATGPDAHDDSHNAHTRQREQTNRRTDEPGAIGFDESFV